MQRAIKKKKNKGGKRIKMASGGEKGEREGYEEREENKRKRKKKTAVDGGSVEEALG